MTVADLEPKRLRRYAAQVADGRYRLNTVATVLSQLRRFTAWLAREGHTLHDVGIAALPPARAWRAADPVARRVLSPEEVAQLFAATAGEERADPRRQRDRALLELLYTAGVRRAEAAAVLVSDLDLADGQLAIRRGKGGAGRHVPLPARAVTSLGRYVRGGRERLLGRRGHQSEELILGNRGRGMAPCSLGPMVAEIAERAGVRAVTPHMLRHAIATHLVRAGVPLRAVQLFLGHRSLRATTTYLHLDVSDVRRAIERAHPREAAER